MPNCVTDLESSAASSRANPNGTNVSCSVEAKLTKIVNRPPITVGHQLQFIADTTRQRAENLIEFRRRFLGVRRSHDRITAELLLLSADLEDHATG